MPIRIVMPALSPTMTEGKIGKWIKKEGDKVKSGDILAEIETDKATIEYEASDEGVLGKILVSEGTEGVAVNKTIAVLLEKGESASDIDKFIEQISGQNTVKAGAGEVSKPVAVNAPVEVAKTVEVKNNTFTSPLQNEHRVFISPLAKRIASLSNLDVTKIVGSGPNGRIIKHDVELALKQGVPTHDAKTTKAAVDLYEDKPASNMRKVIAKRLLESKQNVPHYYLSIDCEMDALLDARVYLNDIANEKYKLSVNDFIIKATAMAMKDVPDMNASWMGDFIRYFKTSDVAVAVATDSGLITPIVRNADAKGLVDISNEMKALIKKAKENKLSPSEYQGGGFSISNLGMFGTKNFAAIINPPQAGILAVGATEKRAIVKADNIVIAQVMSVTVSADHRVVDGAIAAKFLSSFKKFIENPVAMIL